MGRQTMAAAIFFLAVLQTDFAPATGTGSKAESNSIVKVYDITGLLDPNNLERSKSELINAIRLAAPATTCCGCSVVILSHVQRLVVRQTAENQERVDRLLHDLKASIKAKTPAAPARRGPVPLALDF